MTFFCFSYIFPEFSDPVDVYTVFLRASRAVKLYFVGARNPGQKLGQKSDQNLSESGGQTLLTGGAG